MFKIAHLSDLHLGPLPPVRLRQLLGKRLLGYLGWQRGRRRHHTGRVLEGIICDAAALGVDHTVITGDLVNIGLPDEFSTAAAWLREFGRPDAVTVVPGNHDAYVASALGGWAAWATYMGGDAHQDGISFPFLRRCGPVVLIGLSTAIPTPAGLASGRLGAPQLERFAAMLAGLRDDPALRIILLHHPPVAGWSKSRKALRDAAAFRETIAAHGADLILCGHEHRLAIGAIDGATTGRVGEVPVFCAPSASLGRAQGRRSGGYMVYSFDLFGRGWRMQAQHRAIDPRTGEVAVQLEASFTRSPDQRRVTRVA